MLFDTEQAPARMNMFRITSPYGFCDLVKIIIVGQCLESFIRGPFASNLRHERKKPKTETPKTSHGLAKLFEDFKIINTSAQPRLNRRGSTDSDSVTSMDDSPGNIGPAPPPSPWANVPVRHIPGARRRSRVSINGMSAAFASWNGDSRSSISSRGWHNSAYSSINLSDKSQKL
ncbi:hypothetical protein BC830DRAFT_894713 [Chytriomyces sp. MP71]|nr:hypothetical protein BC830DRAFT_894713 [Chytriomyces sp. MP71]